MRSAAARRGRADATRARISTRVSKEVLRVWKRHPSSSELR